MVTLYGKEQGPYDAISKETRGEYDINSGCVYIKDYHELFKYYGYLYITEDGYLAYSNYCLCYGDPKSPKYLTWEKVKQFKMLNESQNSIFKLSEDGLCIIRNETVTYACPDWFKSTLNLCDYSKYEVMYNIDNYFSRQELIDKCTSVRRIIVSTPDQLLCAKEIVEISDYPERTYLYLKEPFEKYPKEEYEYALSSLSALGVKILMGCADKSGKIVRQYI